MSTEVPVGSSKLAILSYIGVKTFSPSFVNAEVYTIEQLKAYSAHHSASASPQVVAQVREFMMNEVPRNPNAHKNSKFTTPKSPKQTTFRPESIEPGMIVWLPTKDQCKAYANNLESVDTIDPGCFNRPVLVYATDSSKQQVLALTVTTFGNRLIHVKYPGQTSNSLQARRRYLPIWPTTHPDIDFQLVLDEQLCSYRQSYVQIKDPLILDMAMLKPYANKPRRLQDSSLRALPSYFHFDVPENFSAPSFTETYGEITEVPALMDHILLPYCHLQPQDKAFNVFNFLPVRQEAVERSITWAGADNLHGMMRSLAWRV